MIDYHNDARGIHPRRTKVMPSEHTPDGWDYVSIPGREDIGRFEHRYGYPTDIDKVWEERERTQNG